jgi:tetratricopeptide (TPR) repeat protein
MYLYCACGGVSSVETNYSSFRAKISPGWATSTTNHSSTSDPAEAEAVQCLEYGTQKLEEGDVQAAKALYKRSVEIRRNASSLFNLGVTHYHLSASLTLIFRSRSYCFPSEEFDEAIASWKESIALQPTSPDAHTSA